MTDAGLRDGEPGAVAELALGDLDAARAHLRRAVELFPVRPTARALLERADD
jgi:hypothetical protein